MWPNREFGGVLVERSSSWHFLKHRHWMGSAIDADVVNVVGMQAFTRKYLPGIFKVWRPDRIEKILPESKRGSEEHLELAERGITAVFVPDNDPDHQGTVYDKDEENGNSEEAAA